MAFWRRQRVCADRRGRAQRLPSLRALLSEVEWAHFSDYSPSVLHFCGESERCSCEVQISMLDASWLPDAVAYGLHSKESKRLLARVKDSFEQSLSLAKCMLGKEGVAWECVRNSDSSTSHLISTEIPGAWLRYSRAKTREMLLTI